MAAAALTAGVRPAGLSGRISPPPPATVTPEACAVRQLAQVERVDVGSEGEQTDGRVYGAALSADGRYVAFGSDADNLVPGDLNGRSDVFVRDLRTGVTTRVSVSSAGEEGNDGSYFPAISADGRYVTFRSKASNLVPDDGNDTEDIFVHDRLTGETARVSVGEWGREANGRSYSSAISADGRYVVFTSAASDLVPADRNGVPDVFVRDLGSQRTFRVSVGLWGEANGRSEGSSISADGHVVAFRSFATDLVPADTNGLADDFTRDWVAGSTQRVNVSSAGRQADGVSYRVFISGNGRFVGFRSRASNLVPNDSNNALDVFEHDRITGVTTLISSSSDGEQAQPRDLAAPWAGRTRFMSHPVLSANGLLAAFGSRAADLVHGDTNHNPDVFLHHLRTGETTRVSVSATGRQANRGSYIVAISGNGHRVLFYSAASNLVCGDTNHLRDLFVRTLPAGSPRDVVAGSGRARKRGGG